MEAPKIEPDAAGFDTLDGRRPAGCGDKPTDPHWRRIRALYPKSTHVTDATEAWSEIVEAAPDPVAEAERVLAAVRVIDGSKITRRYLPNLRDFIAKRRYLEDWAAAANEEREREAQRTGVPPPIDDAEPPWVPPWETEEQEQGA